MEGGCHEVKYVSLAGQMVCAKSINNVFNHTIVEKQKVVPIMNSTFLNTSCILKLSEESLKCWLLRILADRVKCMQGKEVGD